ncbi:gamma-crystallin N-B isoform X2 [Gambusia affinis]|uniref:gamma-crystallin N-B isoform X2 n=1 Tax=Gambusia affinis TaxID=33528 RepID=UPI001CDC0ABC|nr:gamma-crystallin N-B isoform X2 [Gambusia affinis]
MTATGQQVDTAGQVRASPDPGSDGVGCYWFWVWYQTSSWQVRSHQNIRYRFHPDGSVVVPVQVIQEKLLDMITFYEGRCFTGRKLEVRGDCDNFQDRGFMNRVNSIRVESGAWICYDHPDFRGQQYILEHGEYPEFQRWNSHNDHMGSCKPIRMHGEHYRIELFEACNFSGQCMDICDDCPFLQSRGFSKSCINSVRVYGDGAWVMYEEPNFRGRMYIVERGNYCSPTEWQAQNPNIQSIRRIVNYF